MMVWSIRFLRVAMWLFRVLALVAVAFAVASIFFQIGFAQEQFRVATFRISQWERVAPGLTDFWADIVFVRVIPAFIFALIFYTLSALIGLNLRFYATIGNMRR